MIQAHRLTDTSIFLGQTCALCKQELVSGDEIVICPEDGSRHHVGCWQANGNKCTAYGCTGAGQIGVPTRPLGQPVREHPARRTRVITQDSEHSPIRPPAARPIPNAPGSKVRTLPAGSFGCARTCLFITIILVVILLAISCFGLWALANRIMMPTNSVPIYAPLFEALAFIPALSPL